MGTDTPAASSEAEAEDASGIRDAPDAGRTPASDPESVVGEGGIPKSGDTPVAANALEASDTSEKGGVAEEGEAPEAAGAPSQRKQPSWAR